MAVTVAVAALLVAAKKLWNCAPPGPILPPNVQSALAANGVTVSKPAPKSTRCAILPSCDFEIIRSPRATQENHNFARTPRTRGPAQNLAYLDWQHPTTKGSKPGE